MLPSRACLSVSASVISMQKSFMHTQKIRKPSQCFASKSCKLVNTMPTAGDTDVKSTRTLDLEGCPAILEEAPFLRGGR